MIGIIRFQNSWVCAAILIMLWAWTCPLFVFSDDVQRGLLFSGMSQPTDQRAICDKCLTMPRVGSQRSHDYGDEFPKQQQDRWEEQSHI